MAAYLPRIADQELATRLKVMVAVLIEGPKACGKTDTASQVAKTIIRFDEDSTAFRGRTLVAPNCRASTQSGQQSQSGCFVARYVAQTLTGWS